MTCEFVVLVAVVFVNAKGSTGYIRAVNVDSVEQVQLCPEFSVS